MEFWLVQEPDTLRLPVPPRNYALKKALNNSSVIVEGLGEVCFIGKPKLTEIPPIESFFPRKVYSFCQYKTFPAPRDCVALIEKWLKSGKPIRYIVPGSVNIETLIDSFEYGERDGSGDIYFSLCLREYRTL